MTTETHTVSQATAADPWATSSTNTDPWASSTDTSVDTASSWLSATPHPSQQPIDWVHPFQDAMIPFDHWIEAGNSFGASPKQMLYRIQLPLAMPTIMAGVNQTLMLSLSMVVIASMIAVGGLGQMVLRGIARLDMGLAAVGGLGIVILAILLDRITQSLGNSAREKKTRWYQTGPASAIYKLTQK